MSLYPFPNVPKVPGVPAIPRSPNFPPTVQAGLGIIQAALWRVFQTQTRWGIFDAEGRPLADPSRFEGIIGAAVGVLGGTTSSTDSVEYTKETRVSDFPLERGSFANYNKVEMPASPNVTLCMSGSEADRKKFLDAIDAATKSTDLYSVVTPEITYIDYAIERYNYQRRNSRGATLLIVQLSLKEIRQVSAQYAQTIINKPKDVGAVPQIDNGKVQAKPPAQSVLKSVANKFPTLGELIKNVIQGGTP